MECTEHLGCALSTPDHNHTVRQLLGKLRNSVQVLRAVDDEIMPNIPQNARNVGLPTDTDHEIPGCDRFAVLQLHEPPENKSVIAPPCLDRGAPFPIFDANPLQGVGHPLEVVGDLSAIWSKGRHIDEVVQAPLSM